MNKTPKIIVAHPGKQHSFRLATALKQKDMLYKYLTTVYYKRNSKVLPLIDKLTQGKLSHSINSRKCEFLDDNDVVQFYSFASLIILLLVRINNNGKIYHAWNNWITNRFGIKVAKYAIKNRIDVVIMYDTTADTCFQYLKRKAPHIKLVIDSSAACNEYVVKTFERDLQSHSEGNLRQEAEHFWNKQQRECLSRERFNTDIYLVPSLYCKRSLLPYINSTQKIFVQPYGSNFKIEEKKEFFIGNRLNFLFLGQVSYRKGAHYLLQAFSEMQNENIKLYMVGMYDKNAELYSKYRNLSNVEFCGFVGHNKIQEYFMKSEIMIIPSLSEGMTLAGLEGLSQGVPLICTETSGVNDLINNYENGIVIREQDASEILNAVKWFILHTANIPQMSKNACNTAREYTWDRYYSRMGELCKYIFFEDSLSSKVGECDF